MPARSKASSGSSAPTSLPTARAAPLGHEPDRTRKLLLHHKELAEIERAIGERGLTLVPLRLYLKHGLAKVELGLGRGRKVYDKRQAIAKRDADRQMQRAVRHAADGRR